MEIRKQIVGDRQELKKILTEYLLRQGFRIKESSVEITRDDGFQVLTMTEEEIYREDTYVILTKPLASLSIDDKLKEKLLNKFSSTGTPTIADLLKIKRLDNSTQYQQFKTGNQIEGKFFTTSTDPKAQKGFLSDEEEKLLIQTFGDLGIILNPHEVNS
jgi:hypothetical protein